MTEPEVPSLEDNPEEWPQVNWEDYERELRIHYILARNYEKEEEDYG